MKDFLFDLKDYKEIPGLQRPWDGERPFLVPIFFEKSVLTRYLYDSTYKCEFCSETYGTINLSESYISFGINPNGLIIMWLGDLEELPEKEKLYLLSHNIPSDHNIKSEFYDAQIDAQFTDPVKEVDLLITKNKLNEAFNKKFNFKLFKTEYPDTDSLFSICSKYKKVLLNGEDDFKRIISEWNELLIEDIDFDNLKKYTGINDMGGIKLLETLACKKMSMRQDLIQPYFVLYNLRIWADHKNCEDKFSGAIEQLGLDKNVEYFLIYQKMLEEFLKSNNELLDNLISN